MKFQIPRYNGFKVGIFRISPILNSEFRISKKNVVHRKFVFGDATSGSVHGVGPFHLKLEQFKQ